ncbi:MAG TPA: tannase/feruloyl esterase family alpha/beta hydrolase, partial [Povalibacter sp.]
MRDRWLVVAMAIVTSSHARAADTGCNALHKLSLADVTIEEVTAIQPAPVFVIESDALSRRAVSVTVPFCRVRGRIEKEIEFEVWLPSRTMWNGKHLGVGNGGYAGFINYGALAHGLGRGYATAATDTGHQGGPMDASWALGHPQRIENYGGRAQHLTAVTAKQIVQRYYARPPRYSYFAGCSNGGQQGLTAAQRYPADYDGIVAGAPGTNFPDMSTYVMLSGQRNGSGPDALTQAQMEAAVASMTAACDAADGARDGLIEYPPACAVDFEALACERNTSAHCLRAGQVHTLAALFAPLKDAEDREIYPPPAIGTLLPVSELTRRGKLGADMYRYLVFSDPQWDVGSFALARDLPLARERLAALIADETDLTPFAREGGRLILYHGWSDSGPSPFNSIHYFEGVQRAVADRRIGDFFRLFMVPGMYHCGGGPGPDSFGNIGNPPVLDADHDVLKALERWVEQGEAPARIVASKVSEGRVERTRPLCPY